MNDQRVTRSIAITGGKGGVGKTVVSVNLAIALAKSHQNVLLFDADLGLANIDVSLGLRVDKNLAHVLNGECDINDILLKNIFGVDILPASSGDMSMANVTLAETTGIINEFSRLQRRYNTLIVDTPAGISQNTLQFCKAAQEVIVVVCNEPSSITDAYAVIKNLHTNEKVYRFHVVGNMLSSYQEGAEIYAKLKMTTSRFLEVNLGYLGGILHDEFVKKAIKQRKPVVEKYPNSKAAISINEIAHKIDGLTVRRGARGYVEFFLEQFLNPGAGVFSN